MPIELYPAVDVLGGKAVRLEQGDYQRSKLYDVEPVEAAKRWVDAGARRLHVVDLDGAREGAPRNLEQLQSIARAVDVPIQYGGGLRTLDAARSAVAAGASRIVLGTVAVKERRVLDAVVDALGEHLAVSIDVRGGKVATEGWLKESEVGGEQAILSLRDQGVSTFIYTNVDRDGTLAGLRVGEISGIAQAVGEGELVWSGGIGQLDDLRQLAAHAPPNLGAVIVGKALYEKRFTVSEALEVLP